MNKKTEKAIIDISRMLHKNFSNSKKLTEGDIAFQQYAMENRDVVGSSTPPIDIVEPPVKKAGISTMAPNELIGENNFNDEIEYDNPVDKVKKDYSGGVAFSTQHQIPGEMSNQISEPKEVNASEENEKYHNMVSGNKEPFFSKMNNDEALQTIKKSFPDEDIEEVVGILKQSIFSEIQNIINKWFSQLDTNTDKDEAMVLLKKELFRWRKETDNETSGFDLLAMISLASGIQSTGAEIPKDALKLLEKKNPSSVLDVLINDIFNEICEEIKYQNIGSFKQKRAIDAKINEIEEYIASVLISEATKIYTIGTEYSPEENLENDTDII